MGKWRSFNRFSPAKKAALLLNLKKTRSAHENKENLLTFPGSAGPSSAAASGSVSGSPAASKPSDYELRHALGVAQARIAAYEDEISVFKRELYNTHRREVRAQDSKTNLKYELREANERVAELAQQVALMKKDARMAEEVQDERTRQEFSQLQDRNSALEVRNEALLKRVKRAHAQAARAVERAVRGAIQRVTTLELKEKGIISDTSRDLVWSLTYAGVPRDKIPEMISTVAEAAGLTVKGSISTRSVGRINLEGGILSDLQTVEEMREADGQSGFQWVYLTVLDQQRTHKNVGITLSSDGTGIKHIQHEARHAYINKGDTHSRRFLGITTAPSHTSEEQLHGWIEALESLCTTWNMSPRGQDDPMQVADILGKIKGMNTDHAEDQKKLVRLFMELKIHTDREQRGQRAILEGALAEFQPITFEEIAETIKKAGGSAQWERLPEAARTTQVHEATRRATVRFGETWFAALSDEEKRAADLFL